MARVLKSALSGVWLMQTIKDDRAGALQDRLLGPP
jgi:hypothetical protein